MPPGSRLLAFASRWFDEPTVATVFQPLVADWQHEWSSAPAGRRRGIAWRGRLAFLTAFVVSLARVSRAPIPSWLVRRIVLRIAVFFAIVGLLGMARILRPLGASLNDASLPLMLMVVLLPILPLLTMLLPFATAVGLDPIRGNKTLPPAVRRSTVTKLLVATTLWMIIGTGWIVPATDQVWRTAVVRAAGSAASNYVPPRGMRELSTYELVLHPDRAFVQRQTQGFAAGLELWRRVSLIILPFVLAFMYWNHFNNLPQVPPGKWLAGLAGSFAVTVVLQQLGAIGMFAFLLLPVFALAQDYLSDDSSDRRLAQKRWRVR